MKFKRFTAIFLLAAILAAGAVSAFCAAADPFGVFGDRFTGWWSYDMTQNPRAAKIEYLQKNHEKYDAYIIGCSKSSSYPVEALNEYTGKSWYNLFMYGGDMYDIELTAEYVLDNYSPKELMISLCFEEAAGFHTEKDSMKQSLNARVEGTSMLLYRLKYAFINPDYAINKLVALKSRGILPTADSVFDAATGAYDKRVRDVEPIGEMNKYLTENESFTAEYAARELSAISECCAAAARIRAACEERGVAVTFVLAPCHDSELEIYGDENITAFRSALAKVTPFWDFSHKDEISADARYFYDYQHFRNCVGEMALARIYGGNSVYVPEDFGVYVQNGSEMPEGEPESVEKRLIVLMYHDTPDEAAFRAHLQVISDAGYETAALSDLADWVAGEIELPEKCLVITFDDGYATNIDVAAPLLEEFGFCGTINVIGVSEGKSVYKDTGHSMRPHFSYEDALPYIASGVVELQSHSWDMHNVPELDGEDCRKGVLMLDGESEQGYASAFLSDFERSRSAIEDATGQKVTVYAYPYGYSNEISDTILAAEGIKITLSTTGGENVIVRGLPQSLLRLNRTDAGELAPEALAALLS